MRHFYRLFPACRGLDPVTSHRALADERLSERVDRGLVNVLPMTVAERRAAIEEPGAPDGTTLRGRAGGADPNAIADAPGDLPLMEFALTELWQQQTGDRTANTRLMRRLGRCAGRSRSGRMIHCCTELREAGGGADGLHSVGAGSATGRGSRGHAAADWHGGVGTTGARRGAYLADARLRVTDRDPASGEETVEVAHEALIRGWQELRGWLDRDREFLLWRQRIRTQTGIWEDSGRDEGALLREALLREAQVRMVGRAGDLSALELAFIEESERATRRVEEEQKATRQRELAQAQALVEEQRQRAKAEAERADAQKRRAEEATRAGRQSAPGTRGAGPHLVGGRWSGNVGTRSAAEGSSGPRLGKDQRATGRDARGTGQGRPVGDRGAERRGATEVVSRVMAEGNARAAQATAEASARLAVT